MSAESTVDIEIDLPAGWVRHDDAPGMVLLARPERWHREPSPSVNVVLTTTPGLDSSPTDYLDQQLAGMASAFGGTLLHLDHHDGDPSIIELAFAYELLGSDFTSVQRHVVDADGNATVATATATDPDWAQLGPQLVATVRSLRFDPLCRAPRSTP